MSDNFKMIHMDHWLNILYGPFPKYFERAKISIIKDAYLEKDLDYNPICVAYFRGVAYSEALVPIASNPDRLNLTGNCKDRMQALFQEKVDLENEKTIIKGYLSRVLNLSVSRRDIYCLLPKAVNEHINSWSGSTSDEGINITDCKRVEFQRRNKQFSDMINERILTNLLLNHK